MVAAVVAACAVLIALGLILVALNRSRRMSERRLDVVLARIDSHLQAISTSVAQTVDRIVQLHRDQLQPVPTLDFDAVVDALVAAAAARTGADAVVVRVEGPGGRPIIASLGHDRGGELLERTLASPEGPFRAATIDWIYGPSDDPADTQFHSAIVVPWHALVGGPGTLVAYSTVPDAFGPDHANALHELVEHFAPALEDARRFANLEARILLDPATGIVTERGYEVELERAVARARRTQRPLSLVVVGLGTGTATTVVDRSADGDVAFARLLRRVTRKSDVSCRRGEGEFAILLPETAESGATILTARLREEAQRAVGLPSTFATGLVEWHPDESVEALDARAETALAGRSADLVRTTAAREGTEGSRAQEQRTPDASQAKPADVLRLDALDVLSRAVADARASRRSLTLVVLSVDGLEETSQQFGREAADVALRAVAHRLDESVGNGSVLRLGPGEFALVLAGATAGDAELLLDTLHAHGDGTGDARDTTISAGLTELAEDEDASSALGRAEHALWQARQAGRRGTIVVALTSRRTPPRE
jgi:diguanylate cyclase (GGDEF)-like protein